MRFVPVKNVDTRSNEPNNIEAWMKANNLTLNHSKLAETNKWKWQFTPPPLLPGITHWILCVTISATLSVCSDHVCIIISSCVQSVHVIRILHTHSMCQEPIQTIANLMYTAKTWWGFTMATDWQRVESTFCQGVHSGLLFTHLHSSQTHWRQWMVMSSNRFCRTRITFKASCSAERPSTQIKLWA